MRRGALVLIAAVMLASCGGSSSPSTVPAATPTVATPTQSAATATPTPQAATTTPTASPDPLAPVTDTMANLKASRLVAEIPVDGHPDWQTELGGAVWVGTGDTSVVRIDEATNAVVASVPVSGPCLSLAAGVGSVWSPSCGAHEVDRIDPKTNAVAARIKVTGIPGDGEGQLVAAYGSVWLFTDEAGTLVRIDPKSNRIGATYHLGAAGISLVAAHEMLWATVPNANSVLEIDQKGRVVKTIAVGQIPRFLAAGEGGVWVLGQGQGEVTRIDPATATVVATIQAEVPGQGGCIATGGGSVWVTMPETPVVKIDPNTNAVVAEYKGEGGDCIGFADGSVWLSNNALGSVSRLRP